MSRWVGYAIAALLAAGLVLAGHVYDETYFYRDVHVGTFQAISNITVGFTNGGTWATGTNHVVYYRLSGTNGAGRIPVSAVVTADWTATAESNAVVLRWHRYDGIWAVVIERSFDATNWTNWTAVSGGSTQFVDYGTGSWNSTVFTSTYALVPTPVFDIPFEATNLPLDGLQDVGCAGAQTGDVLRYDGAAWTNTPETSLPAYPIATDVQARVAVIETDRLSLAEGGTVEGPVTAEWAEVRQLLVGEYGSDDGRVGFHCAYAPDAIAWLKADYANSAPRLFYSPNSNDWYEIHTDGSTNIDAATIAGHPWNDIQALGNTFLRWRTWTEEITDTISNRAAATGWDTNTMDLLVDDTNGVYFPWTGSVTQRWVKWNTNCWLATTNITCLSVWNSRGYNCRGGVLITRKHFINASHYALVPGDYVVWMDCDNTPWTGVVSKSANLGDDVQLYELDSEAPDSIAVAYIWNDTMRKWIPRGMSGTWAVVVNSEKRAGIAEMKSWETIGDSGTPFFIPMQAGDSGHPCFVMGDDGQLHLQFCFSYPSGGDCALIDKYSTIVSQLQAWGATDLPAFYEPIHRRNPIPLSPQWFHAQNPFPADGDWYSLATADGSNWLWTRTWSEIYATRDMVATGLWRSFHVVDTGAVTESIYLNPDMTNEAEHWATSGDVQRWRYPGGGVHVCSLSGSAGSVWPSNSVDLQYAGVYHLRIPMSVSQYADTGAASFVISFGGWSTNITIGSNEFNQAYPYNHWDGVLDTHVTALDDGDIYISMAVTSADAFVYDCYVQQVTGGTAQVAGDINCGGDIRCSTSRMTECRSDWLFADKAQITHFDSPSITGSLWGGISIRQQASTFTVFTNVFQFTYCYEGSSYPRPVMRWWRSVYTNAQLVPQTMALIWSGNLWKIEGAALYAPSARIDRVVSTATVEKLSSDLLDGRDWTTCVIKLDRIHITNDAPNGDVKVLASTDGTNGFWRDPGGGGGVSTNAENHWGATQHFDVGFTVGVTTLVEGLNAQYLHGHPWTDFLTNESDPVWNADKTGYYTKVESDARFATGTPVYTESDPVFANYSNAIVWDGDAAGGCLTGTYPNPQLATAVVGLVQMDLTNSYDSGIRYLGTTDGTKMALLEAAGGGSSATNQHALSASNVAGTWTIDYDAGAFQRVNITGEVTNVTVTGAAAAEFAELTLVVANPSVYPITWPTSNWFWMEGTAPKSTTNGWDVYTLWTYSNVTWIGRAGGSDQ